MNFKPVKSLLEPLVEHFTLDFPEEPEVDENDDKVITKILKSIKSCESDNREDSLKQFIQKTTINYGNIVNIKARQVIFKIVVTIFKTTTSSERFHFFEELIDHGYELFIKKQVELNQHTSIIPKDEYKTLVRRIIPYTKLYIAKNNLNNEEIIQEIWQDLNNADILREDTYSIINKKFPDKNLAYIGYEVLPIAALLGFNGDYAKLNIFVEVNNEKLVFKCFVKFIPRSDDGRPKGLANESFIKEKLFYQKFIPIVENFGLRRLSFVPECYMISDNFLLLRDLTPSGFVAQERLSILDFKHLSIAVKQLAKLHSCSILFEEILSKVLKTEVRIDKYFPEMIKETLIKDDSFTLTNIEHGVIFLQNVNYITKELNLKEFQNRARVKFNKMFDYVKKSYKYRNVVCHGDVWWSNILYKHDPNNVPIECVLLDFQIMRYIPPACDIIMLLFICTNRTNRKKYTNALLKDYHNEMCLQLSKFNIEIDDILSFGQLTESIEDYKVYGIFLAMLYQNVNSLPEDILNKILSNPSLGAQVWNNIDDRRKVFEEAWDQMKHDPRFEEVALDLYEICLKG